MEDIDVEEFERNLMKLKDTQESIIKLSSWCLANRSAHKKIVNTWLGVLKKGNWISQFNLTVPHCTLFYIAE